MNSILLKPTIYSFFLLCFSFVFSPIFGQINFSASQVSGCAPIVTNFQSTTPNATSWFWDFGISTSTAQNPNVLFSMEGIYDITLIATYSNGTKDTLTKSNYIQVYPIPAVNFGANSLSICAGDSVTFTDQTTLSSGNITQWSWDFGDGNTGTQQNPSYVYTSTGVYTVTLFVTSQNGCTKSLTKNNYISSITPDVSFTTDTAFACGPPLEVQATSSNVNGSHTWLFGDGNTSTQVNPLHTYTQMGSFDLTHIVTLSNGCSDTLVSVKHVNIGVNALVLSVNDTIACIGDSTHFSFTSSVRGNISWDFGDGNTSQLPSPSHKYDSAGTYPVSASIIDASGCVTTASLIINAFDRPVVDWSTADTTIGCKVPFPVDFINHTTGATSYVWRFVGLPNSTLQNPSVSFTSPGNKYVSLLATGPGGCSTTVDKLNYVKIIENRLSFSVQETGGCKPLMVDFTNSSVSAFPITSWKWSFGNGDSSFVEHPTYTFMDTGYYDISLVLNNSQGCLDTLYKKDFIAVGEKPVADFVADTTTTCLSSPVSFTNQSSHGDSFYWSFGDGDTAMSYNALHYFTALGKMNVTLVASDRGCRDTVSKSNYIDVLAPLSALGVNAKKFCDLPALANFNNLSLGAHRYFWDFGNGDTSSLPNPSTSYLAEGTYPVSLSAWNDSTGCMVTLTDSIRVLTVTSAFAADTLRGCYPLSVGFSDSSINAIQWWWDFGNGSNTSQRNPRLNYTNPGLFDIQLITMNKLQCMDTLVIDSMIHALGVKADFTTVGSPSGCVPFPVHFSDSSAGSGAVVQWQWDFGDGDSSSIQNPMHSYLGASYYDVKLSVTDIDGCQDSIRKLNFIHASQPVPNFIATQPINCIGNPITFITQSSGLGLTYQWDFGDGNTSLLTNPIHSYSQNGAYTVSLTVVDINGCDSTLTLPNYIQIESLDASFVADTTYAFCPPLSVSFTPTAPSTYHNPVTWNWDFGNGSHSSKASPKHNYSATGTYDVILIVNSIPGCTDTVTRKKYIDIDGPVGSFSFTPTSGCPGTSVHFTSTSQNTTSFQWIFGDGNIGLGPNQTHTFPNPSLYHPALVLTDSLGCQQILLSPDTLEIYDPPIYIFSPDRSILCDSGRVFFTGNAVGKYPIKTYHWDFGDGTTSNLLNPNHRYTSPGKYTVTLDLVSNKGCKNTMSRKDLIWVGQSPVASFTVSDTSICAPAQVFFSNLSQSFGVPLSTWNWDFGDTQTSTTQNPAHTYSQTGSYLASLEVIDSLGCTSSTGIQVNSWPSPIADFRGVDSLGCAPQSVQFTNYSTGASQSNWKFGDGTQSSLLHPTHTYSQDGRYTVILEAENTHGCSDIKTKFEYIKLTHPVADFTVSDSVRCQNQEIQFYDLSHSDTSLVDWFWDLGDGTTGNSSSISHSYPNTGTYTIQLTVTDVFGCSNTRTKNFHIEIIPDVTPSPIPIQNVSVLSDTEIEIYFDEYPNTLNHFNRYIFYRSQQNGPFILIDSVGLISQTSWIDTTVDARNHSYCYKIIVENICGTQTPWGDAFPHCTMELSTMASDKAVNLSWTPYSGWNVQSYQVYLVDGYRNSSYHLLGTVSGNDTFFTHPGVYCPDEFSYRVEATFSNPGFTSYSDTSTTIYKKIVDPDEAIHMRVATVENNQIVNLNWDVPVIENLAEVVLEKNSGSGFKQIMKTPAVAGNFKFQDKEVKVTGQSYMYRAFGIDSCGDFTSPGRNATSLFLTSHHKIATTYLEWNPYLEWELGVAAYEVSVFDETTGTYTLIETLPGNVTTFIDKVTELSQATHCYQVVAREQGGNNLSSLSNESCVTPIPRIYVSNIFSPNQDGVNDLFTVGGIFVANYQLSIFNNWGNLVFGTTDISQPWDGTFNGKASPQGVYMYVVEGTGFNGEKIRRTGSLTLIR